LHCAVGLGEGNWWCLVRLEAEVGSRRAGGQYMDAVCTLNRSQLWWFG
jgi:hypothetical protein